MSLAAGFGARRGYYLLALALIVADQASKLAAHRLLRGRGPVEIIPDFFSLWYSRNPGGLFGSFRDWSGPLRFVLLTLLPIAAILRWRFFSTPAYTAIFVSGPAARSRSTT